MKKALLVLAGIVAGALSFAGTNGKTAYSQPQEDGDSTVAVIAWFDKRDTMTYWINESSWNVKDGDTTKTSGVSTKVMLTVADSTKKGYRIEYKFLDFQNDTVADSMLGDFQNRLVERLSDKIVGTSILFRTDEYGHITKYENLKEIKKQAKGLFDSAYEEFRKLPVMDSLKSAGVNLDAILKGVDVGAIVDGYTEEIELLFNCHGKEYKIGDVDEHYDETADEYASDCQMSVGFDPESMEYEISSTVDTKIPAKDLKNMVGAVYGLLSDTPLPEGFEKEYDSQVKEDMLVGTWHYWKYFADGWPSEVISQSSSNLMGGGKLKQTQIVWDYRSVGNSR